MNLLDRLKARNARVGVIGLGYVGLPLAVTAAQQGFDVVGFDVDPDKMTRLAAADSYIEAVTDDALRAVSAAEKFSATTDFAGLAACDVIVICVPTPLTAHQEPDLSYVTTTAQAIAKHLTADTLVVLESTTFPGTTTDVLTPILAESGLKPGTDFFVGFSPEREDPGNTSFRTATIPKIVAGDGEQAGLLTAAFYSGVVDNVVPVSTTATAEAVKITENIFRAVNIALVNELKIIYEAMGIDVWEVIDGAATKPFGFMPFYPGPGLGGHCIPIDPFYLTWKAREYDVRTRFIELAGEINTRMPSHVVDRLRATLDAVSGRGLNGARILLIGVAYKKNVSDMRESPAMKLLDLMEKAGAKVQYVDPHVPVIPRTREYAHLTGRQAVVLQDVNAGDVDGVLIATDHDDIDYARLITLDVPVVDTRNAMARRDIVSPHIVKA